MFQQINAVDSMEVCRDLRSCRFLGASDTRHGSFSSWSPGSWVLEGPESFGAAFASAVDPCHWNQLYAVDADYSEVRRAESYLRKHRLG